MFNYKDININYKDYGNGNNAVLFLHGWGQNIEMMEMLANPLKDTHRIIIVDLPGFGQSEEPKTSWSLNDYVTMLHALLDSLNIKNPSIVGHSFGGKLALLYASIYPVHRLVLLASPYKVKIKKISWQVKLLKKLSKLPLIGRLANYIKIQKGSVDYRNATPRMREILVKHVNTDLTNDATKIKCPTFIIWGDEDAAVDVNDAYELAKLIPDAGLSIYEGCTHYAYLERLNQTIAILKSFLE